MKLLLCATFFSIFLIAGQDPATAKAPLKLAKTIPLPAEVKGHFDHLAIDLGRHRLFVTPEDFKAVLVIDYESRRVIHTISGISKPHAVFYRPDLNLLYVTDGIAGELKIVDGNSYAILKSIPLQKDADAIGYDVSTKQLFVVSGGNDAGSKFSDLSAIDTAQRTKLADLQVDGETLEAMTLDAYRARLYVNNKAKNQIDIVDRWQRKVITTWPVTKGQGNVAMALDEPHQRLFVGCWDGRSWSSIPIRAKRSLRSRSCPEWMILSTIGPIGDSTPPETVPRAFTSRTTLTTIAC